jgi:superfamily II DNA or RNA helicase
MREELSNLLNKSTSKEIVLELSTGVGKSKLALEFINKHYSKNAIFKNVLIVVPRLILINNWKDEIKKWGFEELLNYIVFTTYKSLHKYYDNSWDVICYDEAHHLSDRCKEIDSHLNSKYRLFIFRRKTKFT